MTTNQPAIEVWTRGFRSVALSVVVTALATFSTAHAQQTQAKPSQAQSQPGTFWDDEKIFDTVNAVAMGPKLKPRSWPNGARVAVMLTFDDDTQAPHLRDGETEPTALSAADYGAQTGTPRLLEILDRHK